MKYCIANWKMNLSNDESIKFIDSFSFLEQFNNQVKIIISPSYITIKPMLDIVKNKVNLENLKKNNLLDICAQNISDQHKGAYTGDVSASMLENVGCRYVLVGHSERRLYHKETDSVINEKLKIAQKNNLSPILCIGENDSDREKGQTYDILKTQLYKALDNVDVTNIIIAYEPVWAIGTGKTASKQIINDSNLTIKKILKSIGVKIKIPIIYGGSVNKKNIKELSSIDSLDGFLIGGASLSIDSFVYIYNIMGER